MFIKLQSKQMQWLFLEYTVKMLIYKTFDPIQSNPTQSNPIHGWIQSTSNSEVTLCGPIMSSDAPKVRSQPYMNSYYRLTFNLQSRPQLYEV